MTYFYDLGVGMGILGMMASIGILLWSFALILHDLLGTKSQEPTIIPTPEVWKRYINETFVVAGPDEFLKPLIPGLTVPLSDLPVILGTVFISQLIHELGHALPAALESLPIQSAGVSLTLIVPSAFVAFPSVSLQALSPKRRARIISGGPWHNFVFYMVLLVLGHIASYGGIPAMLGYRNIAAYGRGVISIEKDSPLGDFIPLGSLITKLDDVSLARPEDMWTLYLTSSGPPPDEAMGWCVDRDSYLESTQSCCTSDHSTSSTQLLSCFADLQSDARRCLDPVTVLTRPTEIHRCRVASDCPSAISGSSCVRPDPSTHLMRLTIASPSDTGEILLWSGPKNEVWEQVEVGVYLPWLTLLPLWLPGFLHLFYTYLQAATLSLFVFNLLPLPYLDGEQLFGVLLDYAFDATPRYAEEEYDVDVEEASGERSRRRGRRAGRWKMGLLRVVRLGTMLLFGSCVLLGLGRLVVQ